MDLAGKFMGWFHKGMNTQIPNEATAGIRELISNDWSNRQGIKGPGGQGGWDPTRGFRVLDETKGGLNSGPTALVREVVKRPLRAIAGMNPVSGTAAMLLGDLISPAPLASGTLDDHIQYLQPGGLNIPNPTYPLN